MYDVSLEKSRTRTGFLSVQVQEGWTCDVVRFLSPGLVPRDCVYYRSRATTVSKLYLLYVVIV
jgi:hypothetical protein